MIKGWKINLGLKTVYIPPGNLTSATWPIGKIHPISKISLTFEAIIWVWYPLELRNVMCNKVYFVMGSTISNHLAVAAPLSKRSKRNTQSINEWPNRLDGVAPLISDPQPTSFTTFSIILNNNKTTCVMFHLTFNPWHMTWFTWYVTHDTWHVTHDKQR